MDLSIAPRLDGITDSDWQTLFPDHPDSLSMIRLMQNCGMDGFELRHILVSEAGRPILLLPLFQTRYRLASLVDGFPARIVRTLDSILPALFSPKLLGIGFVEGEWGQVGIAPDLDPATRDAAWTKALDALALQRRASGAAMTVLLNFTPLAVAALPAAWRASLAPISTIPCARLKIDFTSVDEYLSRLSKPTRKDLRRKMKSADDIHIVRPAQIDPWLDRIESLYSATLHRAEMSLGIQRKSFFQRVGHDVDGAHYVLYFHKDQLLAFNLLLEQHGQLIDKYFCMDEKLGRDLNLYFISWIENVRHACSAGLHTYHAGPGAEATKSRLGATFIPSITLFRHRNPLLHWTLAKLRRLLAYSPAVDLQQHD